MDNNECWAQIKNIFTHLEVMLNAEDSWLAQINYIQCHLPANDIPTVWKKSYLWPGCGSGCLLWFLVATILSKQTKQSVFKFFKNDFII